MAVPDEALWRASRQGDRDAFGQIVSRYQNLICSLAYSRTGNFARSQDLAQETFVTAWRRLGDLREPGLLRSWLCGIVRNLAAGEARTERRRGGPAEALDAIAEPRAAGADPETQAVSSQEEALLWRALEGLPEQYREPLVLFYREEQSVAGVAAHLELSEDAVKQRLSRGRAMLRAEVASLIESALARSRPNAAFTAAVLGAIAFATPAAAFAAGAAATGGTSAGKGAMGAVGGAAIVGPATGLSIAWVVARAVGMSARSEPERERIAASFRSAMRFVIPAVVVLLGLVYVARTTVEPSPWFITAVSFAWTGALLAYLIRLGQRTQRDIAAIRRETGTEDAPYAVELAARGLKPIGNRRFVSARRWMGLPVLAFGTSGMDAGAAPARAVRAWIAVGDVAVSPLLALGGIAIAPIAIGGVTVGILSLSLAGIAVGVLAAGSLAAGWLAFGVAAVGWKAAAGPAAIAREFAMGNSARAAEANTQAAADWFAAQWFTGPIQAYFAALPVIVILIIVASVGMVLHRAWQLRRPMPPAPPPPSTPAPAAASSRIHGLDALRAAALLCGIVLHAALTYVLPGGVWAVGTSEPQMFPGWLVYYLHSFRLEVFFMLAGFFGAYIVSTRGVAAYVRDRAVRILLVFAVALYPMKFVLAALWIAGGRATGWLTLPPEVASLPWYVISLGALAQESWPAITITHLWFLYVLACIAGVFLIARAAVLAVAPATRAGAALSRALRATAGSWGWPWLLAAALTPILARMRGMDIDTPDQSLAWHLPVMALYGVFFAFGWWLWGHRDLLTVFTERRRPFLMLGLAASAIASAGIGMRYAGGDWVAANADAFRWATSFGTGLTMTASVFGWTGMFLQWCAKPAAWIRYAVDASYWMYIVHLPVVMWLQVSLAGAGLAWWVQVPIVCAVTVVVTMATYHWGVRRTWVGAWLNGRRVESPRAAAQP